MIHKHHIVPRYKCKELGIDPDFDDNFVEVTRHQHALIHWGYKCNDLLPLLEVCNPPQYVLDMIPLGDNRDCGAAVLIARGEIDEIDMSGENHWSYGLEPGEHPMCGFSHSEETKKKLSIAHTGKVVSEETKEKLRIVRQKQLNDEEYLKKYKEGVKRAGLKRRGENNHNYGKPMTKEVKKKVSNSRKGKYTGKDNHNYGKTGSEIPSYTHGKLVNARNDPEVRRSYKAEWYQKNKEAHLKKCKERRSKVTREQKDERNRRDREWRANNREESIRYGREYREKNKEKLNKYNKEYSEKNKEKKHEYGKEYYIKNKEKRHEYYKKYYAKKKLDRQGKGTLEPFV